MPGTRSTLAPKLAAFMALAYAAGMGLFAAASSAPDGAEARLRSVANHAAIHLQAGMIQRRREMEFLAATLPVKGAAPLDLEALRLFMRRAQELSPYYALIGFVGADGRFLVTSNGVAEGEDVSNRDYFKRGRVGSYVSDAHSAILLAKALGGGDAAPRLIDVATPVVDGSRFLGVLCAHVSAEWAQVIATTTAREDQAKVEIRAAGGEVIASAEAGAREPGERASLQSQTVTGFGDGGAAHWTVIASAPATPGLGGSARSPFAIIALAGMAAFAAIGWGLGRAITGSIAAQTRHILALPAGHIPDLRNEPATELSDLGAAVRITAEELAGRET